MGPRRRPLFHQGRGRRPGVLQPKDRRQDGPAAQPSITIKSLRPAQLRPTQLAEPDGVRRPDRGAVAQCDGRLPHRVGHGVLRGVRQRHATAAWLQVLGILPRPLRPKRRHLQVCVYEIFQSIFSLYSVYFQCEDFALTLTPRVPTGAICR